MTTSQVIRASFDEASRVQAALRASGECMAAIERFVELCRATLQAGGKLLSCGNGGSMCDAMHFAEEWTGRFRGNRDALAAVAFSDPAQLSCIANDFGYEAVFARHVEALGRSGDLLVALSTSGNSQNVLAAVRAAKARDIRTVALLGSGGGALKSEADVSIVMPLATTSDRIQEVHIQILHIVIEAVERSLFPDNYQ